MKKRCYCCQSFKERLVEICRDCTGGTVINRYKKLLEFVKEISYAEVMNHTQEKPATYLLKEIGKT